MPGSTLTFRPPSSGQSLYDELGRLVKETKATIGSDFIGAGGTVDINIQNYNPSSVYRAFSITVFNSSVPDAVAPEDVDNQDGTYTFHGTATTFFNYIIFPSGNL